MGEDLSKSNFIQKLEMLDHTIRIGSTPTFLYFDLNMNARLQTEIDLN